MNKIHDIYIVENEYTHGVYWSYNYPGLKIIDCWVGDITWERDVEVAHAEAFDYDAARSWAMWAAEHWVAGTLPTMERRGR